MAKQREKSVARGIRIPESVDTWIKRAAAKAGKTVNQFVADQLSYAYERRHAK